VLAQLRLERRRDVLAANLTYAEQRALEIGLAIAGGSRRAAARRADGRHEPRRDAPLRATDPRGHRGPHAARGRARHGRRLRLADRIAVLVHGEVIAFDTPEAVRANPRVQEAYLGAAFAEEG
jgi:branched-chain amino acid transport system ATP-binding protein